MRHRLPSGLTLLFEGKKDKSTGQRDALPSKIYALDVKYSPMGRVTIRMVKNSSVLRAETRELSFLKSGRGHVIKKTATLLHHGKAKRWVP